MVQTSSLTRATRALVVAVCLLQAGCVYRMVVQQGNFLDARQVTQVKEGMTRAQVRFLLGTPMLPDAFDQDRWDYLYTLQLGRLDKTVRQRLTVFFTDDRVSRIENVGAPTEMPTTETTPATTSATDTLATPAPSKDAATPPPTP